MLFDDLLLLAPKDEESRPCIVIKGIFRCIWPYSENRFRIDIFEIAKPRQEAKLSMDRASQGECRPRQGAFHRFRGVTFAWSVQNKARRSKLYIAPQGEPSLQASTGGMAGRDHLTTAGEQLVSMERQQNIMNIDSVNILVTSCVMGAAR